MQIGILSDTHGLLRPRVLERLQDSDHILHAGDVGDEGILERLREIAPTTVVRGNVDTSGALAGLPEVESGELRGARFQMVHRRQDIAPSWHLEARLIVFGHSHRPELEWRGRCLLLNPGACGARRFYLPLTLARVWVDEGGRLLPEILSLETCCS